MSPPASPAGVCLTRRGPRRASSAPSAGLSPGGLRAPSAPTAPYKRAWPRPASQDNTASAVQLTPIHPPRLARAARPRPPPPRNVVASAAPPPTSPPSRTSLSPGSVASTPGFSPHAPVGDRLSGRQRRGSTPRHRATPPSPPSPTAPSARAARLPTGPLQVFACQRHALCAPPARLPLPASATEPRSLTLPQDLNALRPAALPTAGSPARAPDSSRTLAAHHPLPRAPRCPAPHLPVALPRHPTGQSRLALRRLSDPPCTRPAPLGSAQRLDRRVSLLAPRPRCIPPFASASPPTCIGPAATAGPPTPPRAPPTTHLQTPRTTHTLLLHMRAWPVGPPDAHGRQAGRERHQMACAGTSATGIAHPGLRWLPDSFLSDSAARGFLPSSLTCRARVLPSTKTPRLSVGTLTAPPHHCPKPKPPSTDNPSTANRWLAMGPA